MTAQDWPNGDTIGFLFPDELVEKYGLQEGDVFTPLNEGSGILLRPANPELIERMRAAKAGGATYRITIQDLSKLA